MHSSRTAIINDQASPESDFCKLIRAAVTVFPDDTFSTPALSRDRITLLAVGAGRIAVAGKTGLLFRRIIMILLTEAFTGSFVAVRAVAFVNVAGAGSTEWRGSPPVYRAVIYHGHLTSFPIVVGIAEALITAIKLGRRHAARSCVVFAWIERAYRKALTANETRLANAVEAFENVFANGGVRTRTRRASILYYAASKNIPLR